MIEIYIMIILQTTVAIIFLLGKDKEIRSKDTIIKNQSQYIGELGEEIVELREIIGELNDSLKDYYGL